MINIFISHYKIARAYSGIFDSIRIAFFYTRAYARVAKNRE